MRISSSGSFTPIKSSQVDLAKTKDPGIKKTGNGQKFTAIFSNRSANLPQLLHVSSLTETPPQTTPKLAMGPKTPSYFQEKSADDMGQKERNALVIEANIAAYPYHQSLDKLADKTESWDLARPLSLDAGKSAGLSTKGSKGFIYDKKTGLTAYILQNPKTKTVTLVLGGTTSGKHAGGMMKRNVLNGAFALKQWVSNVENAIFNKVPKSYTQAKELTTTVKTLMDSDPKYKGFTLTLSGHSKGGGEASYAALSQDPPLSAKCFSSAELGSKLRGKISDDNKAKATECIQHYAIKGDPVPKMNMLRKHLGHLGTLTMIPAKSVIDSPLDRHDKFNQHISSFADTRISVAT
ncbi:MAG: DUF2974 domain-containing protein [Endozoicomonadaceae bacterium]|nr:DUF2974 domain-containing protein [Endozoicomonadaceae bacterium]